MIYVIFPTLSNICYNYYVGYYRKLMLNMLCDFRMLLSLEVLLKCQPLSKIFNQYIRLIVHVALNGELTGWLIKSRIELTDCD